MNNNRKKHKLIVSFLSIIFVIISCLYIFFSIRINTEYSKLEVHTIDEVRIGINQILSEVSTDNEKIEEIKELIKKYPMEILLKKNNQQLFSTLPNGNINNITGILNENVVLLEKQDVLKIGNDSYIVMYVIYHPSMVDYLTKQMNYLLTFTILLCIIILFSVFYMIFILFNPLESIKKALLHLQESNYEFTFDADTNALPIEFSRFVKNIHDREMTISNRYIDLELRLLIEREKTNFFIQIMRGKIHELKTPIHKNILMSELLDIEKQNLCRTTKQFLKENIEANEKLIYAVSELLKLTNTNMIDFNMLNQKFDFVELFNDIYQIFGIYIRNRKLSSYMELPETAHVFMNRMLVELIVHNLLSNMIRYAKEETEINIEIYYEFNRSIVMKLENKISDTDIERIKKINQTGLKQEELQNEQHKYSTGEGITLVKKLVEFVKGDYKISFGDDTIQVYLHLPSLDENGKGEKQDNAF